MCKVTKLNEQQNSSFRLINLFGSAGLREYLTSSTNWNQVQTQTLREPKPYFCRYSEQKIQDWQNLQKLNNPVTTFTIQNSHNEYFWNLLIQILFGGFRYQKFVTPLFENLIIPWGSKIELPFLVGEIFWGATSGWHDKKLW